MNATITLAITRVACLLLAVSLAACDSSSQSENTSSSEPKQKIGKPKLPTTVEEAEQFVQGPWTYTGQGFKDCVGQTIWLRIVFKPDHTADVCWQHPVADSWDDKPENRDNEPYVITSKKYKDTGVRYFAIKFGKSAGVTAGISEDGTIRYATSDSDVDLTRGDKNPFSK